MTSRTRVEDVETIDVGRPVELYGWLCARRHHGKVVFLDLVDATGEVQVVVEEQGLIEQALDTPTESCLQVAGHVGAGHRGKKEIVASTISLVSAPATSLMPAPRSSFDVFDERMSDHLLRYYHLYVRNPRLIGVMRFRSQLMRIVREWFHVNGFVEFDAPILTPATLYEEETALGIEVHGEAVFLTQCAGFYLEAAAQALDKVFNMGPSFRGETSRSKRHLIEYWHIKAELLHGDREDIIQLVEELVSHITAQCQTDCQSSIEAVGLGYRADGLNIPYPRITYEDAIAQLNTWGHPTVFGEGINGEGEVRLSDLFNSPFWIVGIPRTIEPFPYVIDQTDPRVTMVADLIASNGCGELLGVAEKISDTAMLQERMTEKDKFDNPSYQFVRDVHDAACAPHIAFGMGLERLIRWLLNLPHVKYATAFPRLVRRNIYP